MHDNISVHRDAAHGSSVKLACCGISKSTSGRHNFNKMNSWTPGSITRRRGYRIVRLQM